MAMGGVGEAMLLGAAMGGGSAALTGGDPLKGALMGGLTGGAGSAIGGALGGLGGGASTALEATAATTPATASALGSTASSFAPTMANATMPYAAGTNFLEVPGVTNLGSTTAGTSMGQLGSGSAGMFNPNAGISSLPGAAPGAAPSTFGEGMAKFASDPMASIKASPFTAAGAAIQGAQAGRNTSVYTPEEYNGPLKRFKFNPSTYQPSFYAEGGIATLASGGYDRQVGEEPYPTGMAVGGVTGGGNIDLHIPVDIGGGGGGGGGYSSSSGGGYTFFNGDNNSGTGQPAGGINISDFMSRPLDVGQPPVFPRQQPQQPYDQVFPTQQKYAMGGMAYASGGIADLGSYSDGGRMLRGPGDGMSDSIPASISGKRPARLADGEFVVPADVVSHLGNGSTDAGAKTLYSMMDKVRQARTGRKAQGREINAGKYMPA